MSASLFPLHPDLQSATEAGLLTTPEAWLLMDDWMQFPNHRYPAELHPLLARLGMLDWRVEQMPRQ